MVQNNKQNRLSASNFFTRFRLHEFSLAFLKSRPIFPARFFQYRKDAEMTKNKMPVKEFLPLLGVTCAAFIFNTSEFMPIGLLTCICIAKRKARQPA